jgi:Putative DNA-binding domain
MTVSQNMFTAALLDPRQGAPQGLSDANGQPAGRRFDVYRNNVAVSLTEAMRSGFPVVTKLLGRQTMDGLAGLYLRAHPPASPLMMFYGAGFAAFLAGMPQLAHLGYLPDIARLELALRRAYHAADATPIDPARLAALAPDALMQTAITLAPAMQLIRSPWPVHDIWRFNTDAAAAKPRPRAQDVLITRPEFDPLPQPLPAGAATWVDELARGQTLGAAHAAAVAELAGFNPQTPLTLLLQGGAVTSLISKA